MAETPQPRHNLSINLLSLQERVGCGVVVAYAPRCTSLSPNGLACEASTHSTNTLATFIPHAEVGLFDFFIPP